MARARTRRARMPDATAFRCEGGGNAWPGSASIKDAPRALRPVPLRARGGGPRRRRSTSGTSKALLGALTPNSVMRTGDADSRRKRCKAATVAACSTAVSFAVASAAAAAAKAAAEGCAFATCCCCCCACHCCKRLTGCCVPCVVIKPLSPMSLRLEPPGSMAPIPGPDRTLDA